MSALERESIREFVASFPWAGRVLDYGCGRQPYRRIVEKAGAEYFPYDRAEFVGGSGGNVGEGNGWSPDCPWDAILCTQVLMYVPDVYRLLRCMREALVPGGALVLTYPGAWPEIDGYLHSFTEAGMARLLRAAGFEVERHVVRGVLPGCEGFSVPFGHGTVARA